MKNENELVAEIMRMTLKIQEEFPELSDYLLESPIKSKEKGRQVINHENLINYWNSLNAIYNRYSENNTDPKKDVIE